MNEEQENNLRKLSEYLLSDKVRMDFNMRIYCHKRSYDDVYLEYLDVAKRPDQTKCGTVGCALGHGPDAGVILPFMNISWTRYCWEAFGILPFESDAWNYLFDASWAQYDNSASGAGRRLAKFIANDFKVPEDW